MTFIHELDPGLFPGGTPDNLLCQCIRKLSCDRQTDTAEIIYHAASLVVNKLAERNFGLVLGYYSRPQSTISIITGQSKTDVLN